MTVYRSRGHVKFQTCEFTMDDLMLGFLLCSVTNSFDLLCPGGLRAGSVPRPSSILSSIFESRTVDEDRLRGSCTSSYLCPVQPVYINSMRCLTETVAYIGVLICNRRSHLPASSSATRFCVGLDSPSNSAVPAPGNSFAGRTPCCAYLWSSTDMY